MDTDSKVNGRRPTETTRGALRWAGHSSTGRGLLVAICVVVLLSATAHAATFAEKRTVVEQACRAFTGFDQDGDGTVEIERLHVMEGEAPAGEGATSRGTLLVIVERRLAESDDEMLPDLRPALRRYARDLSDDGFDAFLVSAKVYAGPVHQDGRTVLGLREFLRKVNAETNELAGAVFVGAFPEAAIVRQYFWHKHGDITINAKTDRKQSFKDVDFVVDRAELVAWRAEIVLSDLDGQWENAYRQPATKLPMFTAVYPEGEDKAQGATAQYEHAEDVYEDFFYVDDGPWTEDTLDGGKVRFRHLGERNAECSPADAAKPNPMALPDIAVSRINARHIALQPQRDIVGLFGEHLLSDGTPGWVRFSDAKQVPWGVKVWEPDPLLERELLLEFFERNHRYRQGEFAWAAKPASIVTEFGSGMGELKEAFPAWKDFSEAGYDLAGDKVTLLEYVEWMKRPALLRFIKAHSDPWGSYFGPVADHKALEAACGGPIWNWIQRGSKLVPGLPAQASKLDFALSRTLWENRALPDCANLFLHTGCEGIAPEGASSRPYSHPSYGYWQGSEALLFYGHGLAVVGRAKVFYDEPRQFARVLADGGTWGRAWQHYFQVECEATNVDEVGGGIGRKRAYFWSPLGDWTVRIRR